jgi:hypothetical protein
MVYVQLPPLYFSRNGIFRLQDKFIHTFHMSHEWFTLNCLPFIYHIPVFTTMTLRCRSVIYYMVNRQRRDLNVNHSYISHEWFTLNCLPFIFHGKASLECKINSFIHFTCLMNGLPWTASPVFVMPLRTSLHFISLYFFNLYAWITSGTSLLAIGVDKRLQFDYISSDVNNTVTLA